METGAIDPRLPDEPRRNGKMSTASSNSGGAKTKSSEEVSVTSETSGLEETSSKVEVSTECGLKQSDLCHFLLSCWPNVQSKSMLSEHF